VQERDENRVIAKIGGGSGRSRVSGCYSKRDQKSDTSDERGKRIGLRP